MTSVESSRGEALKQPMAEKNKQETRKAPEKTELSEEMYDELFRQWEEAVNESKALRKDVEAAFEEVFGFEAEELDEEPEEGDVEFRGKEKVVEALGGEGSLAERADRIKEMSTGLFEKIGTAGKVKKFFDTDPSLQRLIAMEEQIKRLDGEMKKIREQGGK